MQDFLGLCILPFFEFKCTKTPSNVKKKQNRAKAQVLGPVWIPRIDKRRRMKRWVHISRWGDAKTKEQPRFSVAQEDVLKYKGEQR